MKGREIHGSMLRCLAFDSDVTIGNVLVDMYAKGGCVDASQAVFTGMMERNVVSWSTLISCYGIHGMGEETLRVYMEMLSQGPNCITFTSILSSCSHSGLVTDGQWIFELMTKVHGVEATADHYECMVGLLGGVLEPSKKLLSS
uniref:Pentatricopeptide repeat-containing protein n=1 Tax=Arundo donax TaxID=35708 RepID=A0A0A8XSN7_ARUDO